MSNPCENIKFEIYDGMSNPIEFRDSYMKHYIEQN